MLNHDRHALDVAFHCFDRKFIAAQGVIFERFQAPKNGFQSFAGKEFNKSLYIGLRDASCPPREVGLQRQARARFFFLRPIRRNQVQCWRVPTTYSADLIPHLPKSEPAGAASQENRRFQEFLVSTCDEWAALAIPIRPAFCETPDQFDKVIRGDTKAAASFGGEALAVRLILAALRRAEPKAPTLALNDIAERTPSFLHEPDHGV